jgi:DNA-binding response OmpR family regulator
MDNANVLIIEDDEVLSKAIHAGLSTFGFQTRVANTYSTGIEMLTEGMPEVLILDIELPDGNGWDIISHLRANYPAIVPAVVVTTSTRVSRTRLREFNISRYLPKPFGIPELVESIRDIISRKRSADPASPGQPA